MFPRFPSFRNLKISLNGGDFSGLLSSSKNIFVIINHIAN